MKLSLFCISFALISITAAAPLPVHWSASAVQAKSRRHSAISATLPDGSPGIRFCWESGNTPYGEFVFTKPIRLGRFEPCVLRAALHGKLTENFDRIRIRLTDSSGETFQFDTRKRGFHDSVEFEITQEKIRDFWGGDKNGHIDGEVTITGFAIGFRGTGKRGEFTIGRIEKFSLAAIEAKVDTGNPLYLIRPGEESKLAVVFTNCGDREFDGRASCRFEDFYGRHFRLERSLSLPPGGTMRLPLNRPLPAPGHWQIFWTVQGNKEGAEHGGTLQFASLEPSGPTPNRTSGFLFGVHSHPYRWSKQGRELEARAAGLAGIKVLRLDIHWRALQPQPGGDWDFSYPDSVLRLYESHGIEFEALLGAPPRWAVTPGYVPVRPDIRGEVRPQTALYREYIRRVAERYRGKIRFYEQFNEPDLAAFYNFGAEDYIELFRAGAEELRKADPAAVILTGGFATMLQVASSHAPGYIEKALAGTNGTFDIHAHHEHGPFEAYCRIIDEQFLPMRRRLGITAPWYANETALTAAGGREKRQAAALWKKLLFAWSRGAVGYNWYDLRNDGFDPDNGEHNYGLLTNDFQPKPVYVAYNTLTGLFRTKKFLRQLPAPDGIWLFEFADHQKRLLAAWSEVDTPPATLLFQTSAAGTVPELVDLMGNRRPIPTVGGCFPLEASEYPVAVELPVSTDIEPAGQLFKAVFSGAAVAGKTFAFQFTANNPLPKPENFVLRFSTPPGIRLICPELRISLAAGESRCIPIEAQVDAKFRLPSGVRDFIKVEWQGINSGWTGCFKLPVLSATVIPAKRNDGAPDFLLNRREQVHSLIGADPSREHLNWKGPEDLSATARLSQDGQNFILAVDVTDDRHCQPFSGSGVWQGDCVQFAIAVPEHSGLWEIGLTRRDDGKNEVFCWSTPDGLDPAPVMKTAVLKTERNGNRTSYQVSIPLTALKLSPKLLRQGFRFNLLINDNDGEGRENWIHIVPGIGESKTPEQYPLVVFE